MRYTKKLATTVALTILFVSASLAIAGSHPMEGKQAPPIKLKTLKGKFIHLARVKADVIVLDFWATWCPPCRQGLPLLQEFENWAKQEKKSVAVFAVNLKEKPHVVKRFWEEQGFNMTVLMDTAGKSAKAYGVRGIPQTVIIHRGKIEQVHVGFSPNMVQTLKAQTEALLSKSKN